MVLKYHYLLAVSWVCLLKEGNLSIERGQFETIYSVLNLSCVLKDTKICGGGKIQSLYEMYI